MKFYNVIVLGLMIGHGFLCRGAHYKSNITTNNDFFSIMNRLDRIDEKLNISAAEELMQTNVEHPFVIKVTEELLTNNIDHSLVTKHITHPLVIKKVELLMETDLGHPFVVHVIDKLYKKDPDHFLVTKYDQKLYTLQNGNDSDSIEEDREIFVKKTIIKKIAKTTGEFLSVSLKNQAIKLFLTQHGLHGKKDIRAGNKETTQCHRLAANNATFFDFCVSKAFDIENNPIQNGENGFCLKGDVLLVQAAQQRTFQVGIAGVKNGVIQLVDQRFTPDQEIRI